MRKITGGASWLLDIEHLSLHEDSDASGCIRTNFATLHKRRACVPFVLQLKQSVNVTALRLMY